MMTRITFILCFFIVFLQNGAAQAQEIEIHGHRGARAYAPENTTEGFIKALELGAEWLELDLVVTGESQLLISHEPYFNHAICAFAGRKIDKSEKRNIYQMNYAEIKRYDCGCLGNPKFPEQQKISAHKPLFSEAITEIEKFVHDKRLPLPHYNVEVKSTAKEYDVSQPQPEVFAQMVYLELKKLGILSRCMVQSFDPTFLNAIHVLDPQLKLGLLVANARSFEANLNRLVFKNLYAYNPYYKLVGKKLIRAARAKKIKIIPWTVNDERAMARLISLGVDGIISDYPDRVAKVRADFK